MLVLSTRQRLSVLIRKEDNFFEVARCDDLRTVHLARIPLAWSPWDAGGATQIVVQSMDVLNQFTKKAPWTPEAGNEYIL